MEGKTVALDSLLCSEKPAELSVIVKDLYCQICSEINRFHRLLGQDKSIMLVFCFSRDTKTCLQGILTTHVCPSLQSLTKRCDRSSGDLSRYDVTLI